MRNVDGAEKMADALRLVHHIEVMQMRTVGAAAENAAKHIDHDGEAAAFRAADRHERAARPAAGSVVGLPSLSSAQPSGIDFPSFCARMSLPSATTLGAISSTTGRSSDGAATEMGFVPM